MCFLVALSLKQPYFSKVYRILKKVKLRNWETHRFERLSFCLKGFLPLSSRYLLVRIQTVSRGNSNDLFDGSIVAGLVAGINQYRPTQIMKHVSVHRHQRVPSS